MCACSPTAAKGESPSACLNTWLLHLRITRATCCPVPRWPPFAACCTVARANVLTATDLSPQDTGAVLQSWGANFFYMPHGLTVDPEGNIWVTDVGLQQALKFSPSGKLLQSLGQQLEPGSNEDYFCKPTHVSARSGELRAALRAVKVVAVISCRAPPAGSQQGMGCLLLGMPASPAPAGTAPRCTVSHLHATQAHGHLTG